MALPTINVTGIITRNLTNDQSNLYQLHPSDIIVISLMSLVFCIGVVGNSIVIYVVRFQFKRRSKREELILILGVVDLIASITNPPLFIYYTITNYRQWHFGEIACKVLPTLGPIMTCFSAGVIIIMTIDRDRSISTPLKKPYSITTIYTFVVIALVLSVSSYMLYAVNLEPIPGYTCGLNQEAGKNYYRVATICIILAQDVLFTVMLTVTSIRVYRKVNSACQVAGAMFGNSMLEFRRQKLKRVTRLLIVIGLLFALSTFPRDLFQVSYYFSQLVPPKINVTQQIYFTNSFLKVLHVGNSCINIFIYSVMNVKFRKQLFKICLINCARRKKHRNLRICNDTTSRVLEMTTITASPLVRSPVFLISRGSFITKTGR